MRLSRTVLFLLAGAAVLQLVHYYPQMPDTMAAHFDGAGRPNRFQSRDSFFILSGAMLAMCVALFAGIGPLFRVLPTSWFNVPNRDYWLSPERREETLDFMARQMEWFGAANLALLLLVLQGVFDANQSTEPALDSSAMWWTLGLYFVYTAVWLVRFLLWFRKPAES